MRNTSITALLVAITYLLPLSLQSQNGGLQLSGFSGSANVWSTPYRLYEKEELKRQWADKYGGLFATDIQEISSYYYYGYPYSPSASTPQFYLHALFTPSKDCLGLPAMNQSLEIGIGLNPNRTNVFAFNENNRFTFDTLGSDLGPIMADSVFSNRLELSDHFERLSLNIRYQISTNPMDRFNFYLAPSLTFDMFFNRSLRAAYEQRAWVSYALDNASFRQDDNLHYNNDIVFSDTQVEDLPNRYGISVVAPIGMRYRVSKSAEWDWLKRVYLYMEGSPGVMYMINQNDTNELRSVMAISLGVRIWGLNLEG